MLRRVEQRGVPVVDHDLAPVDAPGRVAPVGKGRGLLGELRLEPRVNGVGGVVETAMLMVFVPTPRTEEAPPGPGSQILPTPGQTPLELDADVAAAAVVDVRATEVPARSSGR